MSRFGKNKKKNNENDHLRRTTYYTSKRASISFSMSDILTLLSGRGEIAKRVG